MKNLFNFITNDIPNKKRVENALKGAGLLTALLCLVSIVLYVTKVLSFKMCLSLALSPYIMYFGLYLDITIKFLLIGLFQLLYNRIYDLYNKIFKQKS